MNIKLTNFEATELIRGHLQNGLPHVEIKSVEIEIEIESTRPQPVVPTVELMPLIRAMRNSHPPYSGGSSKIAAIKAVRSELRDQGFEGGLADLKNFVEQFIP